MGALVLVALPLEATPLAIGTSVVVGGVVAAGARRTFFRPTVNSDSRHAVLSRLLMGVGWFVTLVGLLFAVVVVAFLHDTPGGDARSLAIVLVPIGALTVGGLLLFVGRRVVRVAR